MTGRTPADDRTDRVTVAVSPDRHHHVVAAVDLAAGDVILTFDGVDSSAPDRFSIQLGASLHVAPPPEPERSANPGRYAWRFLNHSCAPNAAVVGRTLVARCAIRAGAEVTLGYRTTEFEMAEPFRCRCGRCDGAVIRGFGALSDAERRGLAPWLADHLRDRIE
jgi:hypothetical protein